MEENIHFKIATSEDKEVFSTLLREKLQSLKDQGNVIVKEFNNAKSMFSLQEAIFDQVANGEIKGLISLVYDDNAPIGFNLIIERPDLQGSKKPIAAMLNSYIKRKYRKNGVAYKLHEFSLEQIKDEFDFIFSFYEPDKEESKKFYSHFGYKQYQIIGIKAL